MNFNDLYVKIMEDFRAPIDSNRTQKKLSSGKYGSANPQLNSPHSTKSISGFKGQRGGKMHTVVIKMKKKKEEDAQDRCKRKADQVYGKKTSAYKSGAIVRCRQGKIWKKK